MKNKQAIFIGAGIVAFVFLAWCTIALSGQLYADSQQRITSPKQCGLTPNDMKTVFAETKGMDFDKTIKYVNRYVSRRLSYTFKSREEMEVGKDGKGEDYAAMFCVLCNSAFRSNHIVARCQHSVGRLKLFGFTFKDHHFVTIASRDGRVITLDPCSSDLVGMGFRKSTYDASCDKMKLQDAPSKTKVKR